jgi:hypothetical protein
MFFILSRYGLLFGVAIGSSDRVAQPTPLLFKEMIYASLFRKQNENLSLPPSQEMLSLAHSRGTHVEGGEPVSCTAEFNVLESLRSCRNCPGGYTSLADDEVSSRVL